MKLAMLLVSLLTLATGVEAVPSPGPSCEEACLETCKDDETCLIFFQFCPCRQNCKKAKKACKKCIDTMKPNKCNADTCSDPEKKWTCVKTCGLSDTCEAPDDKCEGLTDATKKNGKSKCKIMKKCGKKKDKAKAKCFLKACKKDSCKKDDGKCKKDGKNFCLRTCCENRKSYLGTDCDPDPDAVGTCGSGLKPSSGLTCVPSCLGGVFSPPPATCLPKNPVEGSTCCPKQTCADGLKCKKTSMESSTCEKTSGPA